MKRVCNVCGQDRYKDWFRPPRSPGPVVQCQACGFVYVNPVEMVQSLIQAGPVLNGRSPHLLTSSRLEDIRGSWEEPIIERYMRELPAKRVNAQEALSHIRDLTKSRGALLDVGCFCGAFLNVAAQAGWDCFGVEPLVMPAIYARGQFGLQVITDTLRDDTYPPESFEVVTALQVFEHLIEPAEQIVRMRRFLKPGGLLLIEVPNIDTTLVRLLKTRHRHFVEDHVSFFSAKTLRRLLTRLGFEVRRVYYPARLLSFQHLTSWWIGRYAGRTFGDSLSRLLARFHLDSKTARISLGDIVAVIAEKR